MNFLDPAKRPASQGLAYVRQYFGLCVQACHDYLLSMLESSCKGCHAHGLLQSCPALCHEFWCVMLEFGVLLAEILH